MEYSVVRCSNMDTGERERERTVGTEDMSLKNIGITREDKLGCERVL